MIDEQMMHFPGAMPADFSGSWERNYVLDDEVNAVLREAFNRLSRTSPDQRNPAGPGIAMASSRDVSSLVALARLAEL
ncbi:MAG: hypothetical protein OEM60_09480, partial [Gammaproteobacteria bacterium]|nr:hypothetical protein [Gammaproteobacteria bacterium]